MSPARIWGILLRPAFPIPTARLVLRAFTPADLDELHDFQSRPEVARFLYWEPRSRAQSALALETRVRNATLEREGEFLAVAVELAATGQLIGDLNLRWLSREHRQGEFGFVFHPGHQGRGYAREAATELLRLGFEELGLHRICGRCDARNTASWGLMERLGLRREAHLREAEVFKGEWGEEFVYAMLEDEWRSRCGTI